MLARSLSGRGGGATRTWFEMLQRMQNLRHRTTTHHTGRRRTTWWSARPCSGRISLRGCHHCALTETQLRQRRDMQVAAPKRTGHYESALIACNARPPQLAETSCAWYVTLLSVSKLSIRVSIHLQATHDRSGRRESSPDTGRGQPRQDRVTS